VHVGKDILSPPPGFRRQIRGAPKFFHRPVQEEQRIHRLVCRPVPHFRFPGFQGRSPETGFRQILPGKTRKGSPGKFTGSGIGLQGREGVCPAGTLGKKAQDETGGKTEKAEIFFYHVFYGFARES
jgi:hypothetical protein